MNAGSLGGTGIISSPVTIGSGSRARGSLAPNTVGAPVTLTLQRTLAFAFSGRYAVTFKTRDNQVRADKVVANGVTITDGATLTLRGIGRGTLSAGTRPVK